MDHAGALQAWLLRKFEHSLAVETWSWREEM